MPPNDPFHGQSPGPNGPYTYGEAITPSNDADLTVPARGIWSGTGGAISLVPRNATAPITISNVPAGVMLPIWTKRVRATGTTATGLVAFW